MDKSDHKLEVAAGCTKDTDGSKISMATNEISLKNKNNDDAVVDNPDDWIDYDYNDVDNSQVSIPNIPSITGTVKKPAKNNMPCSDIQSSESPKCKKRKLPSFEELLESLDYKTLYLNFTKLLQFLESNHRDMCFPFKLKDYGDFFKMIIRNISLLKSKSLDAHYRDICDKIAEAVDFKKTGFLLTYVYECRKGFQNTVLVIKKAYVMEKLVDETSSSSSSLSIMRSSETSSDTDTTLTSGFEVHCLRTALAFIKNDVTKTKEFPELSMEQATFMQLLLDSVVAFTDFDNNLETKELYRALWEAVRIHKLKYEFRSQCVETFGGKKNLVFEKLPKTKPAEKGMNLDEPALSSIINLSSGVPTSEASKPEDSNPGSPKPEASMPKASKPEDRMPRPSKPEASKPEATMPGASKPEVPNPEASKPEAPIPEASKPETTNPESTLPGASKPEAPKPEASRPEAPKPEATNPESTLPGASKPEASKPEAPKPEAPKPEATNPESTLPGASKPKAPNPEASKPVATMPGASKPEAPNPEASKPMATMPGASKPVAPKLQSLIPYIPEPMFRKPQTPKRACPKFTRNMRKKQSRIDKEQFFITQMPTKFVSDTLHSILAFLIDPIRIEMVFVPNIPSERDFYRKCIGWCRSCNANRFAPEFHKLHFEILALLKRIDCQVKKPSACKVNKATGIKEVVYVKPSCWQRPLYVPHSTQSAPKKRKVNLQNAIQMAATTDNTQLSEVINLCQSFRHKKKNKKARRANVNCRNPGGVSSGSSSSQTRSLSEDFSSDSCSERGSSWDRSKVPAKAQRLTMNPTEEDSQRARDIADAERQRLRRHTAFRISDVTRKEQLKEALSVPVKSDKAMRMMRGMGWSGGALGARGDGITVPLMPSLDISRGAGFGLNKTVLPVTLPKKPKKPVTGPCFVTEIDTPSVTEISENDIIVQKTRQILFENMTFESILKMIELTESSISNIELPISTTENIEHSEPVTSNAELSKLTSSNTEPPTPTTLNAELPISTTAKIEHLEPTTSIAELSKLTFSNIELPTPITLKAELSKLTTSNTELPIPPTSNDELPKPTPSIPELSIPITTNIELPTPTTLNAELPISTTSNTEFSEPTSNAELSKPITSNIELSEPTTSNIELSESTTANTELSKPTTSKYAELSKPTTTNIELPKPITSNIDLSKPITPNTELSKPITPNTELPKPTTSDIELPESTSNVDHPQEAINKFQRQPKSKIFELSQSFRLKILNGVLELLSGIEICKSLNYDFIRYKDKLFLHDAIHALNSIGAYRRGLLLREEQDVYNQIRDKFKEQPNVFVKAFLFNHLKKIELRKITITNTVRQLASSVPSEPGTIPSTKLEEYITSFGSASVSQKAYFFIKFRVLFLLNMLNFAKSNNLEWEINFDKCLIPKQRFYIEKVIEEINMRIKYGSTPPEVELCDQINIHIKDAFLGAIFGHRYRSVTINKYYRFKQPNQPDGDTRVWETTFNITDFSSETKLSEFDNIVETKPITIVITDSETDSSDDCVATDEQTDEPIDLCDSDSSAEDYNKHNATARVPDLPPGEEGVNLSTFLPLYEKTNSADITNKSSKNDTNSKNDSNASDNRNNKNNSCNGNVFIDDNDNQVIDMRRHDVIVTGSEIFIEYVEKGFEKANNENINTDIVLNRGNNAKIDDDDDIRMNDEIPLNTKDLVEDVIIEDSGSKNDGGKETENDIDKEIDTNDPQDKELMDVSGTEELVEAVVEHVSLEVTNIDKSKQVTIKREPLEVTNKGESTEVTIKQEITEVTIKPEITEVTIKREVTNVEVTNRGESLKEENIAQIKQETSINTSDNLKINEKANLEVKTNCDIVPKVEVGLRQGNCDTQSVNLEATATVPVPSTATVAVPSTAHTGSPQVKSVTITHLSHPGRILTQYKVFEIQKQISNNIKKTNLKHLPLLMCHGFENGRLTYTCHNRKSYDWLKNTVSLVSQVRMSDTTITKMALTFYCFLEFDVAYLFNMIELYNRGLSTKDWVVEKKEEQTNHVMFVIKMDKFSVDYIQASGLALFAGVDKVEFSPVWD